MKFGIGPLDCRHLADQQVDRVDAYDTIIRLSEDAEAAGFDSAWLAEHHFTDDEYMSSPLTVSGAIAAETNTLEVGVGLLLAPFYDPIRLAEDIATLNLIARRGGGQFTAGLGLGYRDIAFDAFRSPREERVARLLDAVDVCRSAWNSESLDVDGRMFDYPEVNVTPKPGSDVKLVIGSNARPGLERAARIGDGYISPPGLSPEKLEEHLDIVHETLLEEDRDPETFDVYAIQMGFVHQDGTSAAWKAMKDEYLYVRRRYLEMFNDDSSDYPTLTEEELENRQDEFEDRWRSEAIYGSPEDVKDQLHSYADAWDHELHVILQLHFPGMAYKTSRQAVETFGERVIPALEDV